MSVGLESDFLERDRGPKSNVLNICAFNKCMYFSERFLNGHGRLDLTVLYFSLG